MASRLGRLLSGGPPGGSAAARPRAGSAARLPAGFRSAAHQGDRVPASAMPAPFPLVRWFALVSAAAILLASTTGTLFLSGFVERSSLLQSGNGLGQVVNTIIQTEGAERFFLDVAQNGPDSVGKFVAYLAHLPDVLRLNIYRGDRSVLWSSDPSLIGRRFPANPELDAALAGTAVTKAGRIEPSDEKPEHTRLADLGSRYVESYLPVWSIAPGERRVIGAVEVYRRPVRLLDAIRRTQQRIWWGALAVSALLYLVLFVIVARAARVMHQQQAALVAAEKLATAGEMASAAAHALRNPLASIRSTAELGAEARDLPEARELHEEVVVQSDRLEGWIRQFLTAARSNAADQAPADVAAVIAECTAHFAPTLARRRVTLATEVAPDLPPLRLCPVMLRQVLNSILANALEAMAEGGELRVAAGTAGHRVAIEVGDTGPGMSPAELAAALGPFATTKPAGLGLGLPLAREAVERSGGSLRVASGIGTGTTVHLEFPAADGQTAGAVR